MKHRSRNIPKYRWDRQEPQLVGTSETQGWVCLCELPSTWTRNAIWAPYSEHYLRLAMESIPFGPASVDCSSCAVDVFAGIVACGGGSFRAGAEV